MQHPTRAAFKAALAVALSAFSLGAQTSRIQGTVSSAEDSSAVGLALVRLVDAADSASKSPRVLAQNVTSAGGQYAFRDVAPGSYRLQLLRIGFYPVTSGVVRVRENDAVRYDLRAPTRAVQLAAMVVRSGKSCLTASELSENARLGTLWSEARLGLETRRAFELQYRYTLEIRQDIDIHWRMRRAAHQTRVDTSVNEPDSVIVRDQRRMARNAKEGYGSRGGMSIVLPNEKELLDESFLARHCISTEIAEEPGAYGLRFEPASGRAQIDIRGIIWIDSATYQVRRIEYEYLDGQRVATEIQVAYGDVGVGGRSLRLPVHGQAKAHPKGVTWVAVGSAAADIKFSYRRFERVDAVPQAVADRR